MGNSTSGHANALISSIAPPITLKCGPGKPLYVQNKGGGKWICNPDICEGMGTPVLVNNTWHCVQKTNNCDPGYKEVVKKFTITHKDPKHPGHMLAPTYSSMNVCVSNKQGFDNIEAFGGFN